MSLENVCYLIFIPVWSLLVWETIKNCCSHELNVNKWYDRSSSKSQHQKINIPTVPQTPEGSTCGWRQLSVEVPQMATRCCFREAPAGTRARTHSGYNCLSLTGKYYLVWLAGVPASHLYFTQQMTLTLHVQSNKALHPPAVKEQWKPSIHLCRLRGGGVKKGSEGRIIIGSSWWGLFRRRGVPQLIPALLPLLGSFPTLFISWLPSRV